MQAHAKVGFECSVWTDQTDGEWIAHWNVMQEFHEVFGVNEREVFAEALSQAQEYARENFGVGRDEWVIEE